MKKIHTVPLRRCVAVFVLVGVSFGICIKATDVAGGESREWLSGRKNYMQPPLTQGSIENSTRDPLKWPFSANSIWNVPIGSAAIFIAANLSAVPGNDEAAPMPQLDEEHIVLRPAAPLTDVYLSSAGWSGANRCKPTGGRLTKVPLPFDYIIPNNRKNSSTVFLMPDGRSLIHAQPVARCFAGAAATALVVLEEVDLYGDGTSGSHGGSGLSAIGGSIRIGELRPGANGPRHALKVNLYAKEALYRCTNQSQCYRWPATRSDNYAIGWYGSANNNSNTAMRMGALLAIPPSIDIGALGLETEPGKQLAWTLQNYGAYIVDDQYGPGFAINTESGPDGSVREQFKNDWGFDMEQRVNDNTPWVRDIQRLVQALYVVDNNVPGSIGGGGVKREPLAPSFR